jgi:hypothetical protein
MVYKESSMKQKWLVTIVQSEIYPMQVEADTPEEAQRLATQTYEANADLEPAESYYFIEDVLEEN